MASGYVRNLGGDELADDVRRICVNGGRSWKGQAFNTLLVFIREQEIDRKGSSLFLVCCCCAEMDEGTRFKNGCDETVRTVRHLKWQLQWLSMEVERKSWVDNVAGVMKVERMRRLTKRSVKFPRGVTTDMTRWRWRDFFSSSSFSSLHWTMTKKKKKNSFFELTIIRR